MVSIKLKLCLKMGFIGILNLLQLVITIGFIKKFEMGVCPFIFDPFKNVCQMLVSEDMIYVLIL